MQDDEYADTPWGHIRLTVTTGMSFANNALSDCPYCKRFQPLDIPRYARKPYGSTFRTQTHHLDLVS